ncbi:hypothetical protein KOW79_013155 [Hemibagrus wyckioides]|uniref:Calx-beta domain-containing protein n=1 Tax=Hemibagrus wyckioides TaxID=337641 RepID=A0A9D3NIC3_9TELE|nr:hypothetical protein KOW79_013155 [Hemibagrus wyckioides]
MMEVSQFVMTAITTDMLAAEDLESNVDDLVFKVVSPTEQEPSMFFTKSVYAVEESAGVMEVQVCRRGSDLSHPTTVTLTSQSAQGEGEQKCEVTIVDDSEYEEEEELRLVLRISSSQSAARISLGKQREALIRISDQKDSSLYPTSMSINDEGQLLVNFRTEAHFREQFILSHLGSSLQSGVRCVEQPELSFFLSLISTKSSFKHPTQTWSFTSEFEITQAPIL